MIYILVRTDTGEFLSAWSTVQQAKEASQSWQLMFKHEPIILAYELDKINQWEVYYD